MATTSTARAPQIRAAASSKPVNLIYGVDDTPPRWSLFLFGLQHIFVMSIGLIIPVMVMRAINGSIADAQNLVSLSMIAGGIGTILQAKPFRGPVGSRYLCPEGPDPSFLQVSISAVQIGGLPLLYGMTIVAGVFESCIAPLLSKLRVLFPAEVTGVVVSMVGLSLAPLTLRTLLVPPEHAPAAGFIYPVLGIATFIAIVGMNVWGKGVIRQYATLIGMTAGYLAAVLLSLLTSDQLGRFSDSPLLAFPALPLHGWALHPALLIPFLIAISSSFLKNVGDITTCQRINDAAWKRPDMVSIRGGVLADGLTTVFAGMIGGMGQASYSANIGLSIASGATSRCIGYVAGGLFILLAFCPKLTAVFANMPAPVMGAALLFCISFMILAGLQIFFARIIDVRKTIVIGLGYIIGLSAMMTPEIYRNVPDLVKPIFTNSLALATVSVIILNLIFRIGISKSAALELAPGDGASRQIRAFLEMQGGRWGARREIIDQAIYALSALMETLASLESPPQSVRLEARFDEFNLDLAVTYTGTPIDFPETRPDPMELLADESAVANMSGFLIRRLVDRIQAESQEGNCRVQIHFEH